MWNFFEAGIKMFPQSVEDKVFKLGKFAIIIVSIGIAFDHWNLINLRILPIPFDLWYYYLVLNSILAAPFIYLEERRRRAVGKRCIQCDSELEISQNFRCPKCGEYNR
jgi:hypothetical protein